VLRPRVIPCLLLSPSRGGLVKTRRFREPKYVGDPINAVRIFNDKEVDELMVLDIDSTRDGRGPNFELIEELAGECFMPLCYGGGIRTAEEAKTVFSLGVEKVAVQSAFLREPRVVREIADHAGEQAVVVSIDIERDWLGRQRVRGTRSRDWREALAQAAGAGAGEILLTSVEREGTLGGMDTALIAEASALVGVPLIANGGAGSLGDIENAVKAGASAVAAGAFFVLHGPHRAVLITYPRYEELRELWERTQ